MFSEAKCISQKKTFLAYSHFDLCLLAACTSWGEAHVDGTKPPDDPGTAEPEGHRGCQAWTSEQKAWNGTQNS